MEFDHSNCHIFRQQFVFVKLQKADFLCIDVIHYNVKMFGYNELPCAVSSFACFCALYAGSNALRVEGGWVSTFM